MKHVFMRISAVLMAVVILSSAVSCGIKKTGEDGGNTEAKTGDVGTSPSGTDNSADSQGLPSTPAPSEDTYGQQGVDTPAAIDTKTPVDTQTPVYIQTPVYTPATDINPPTPSGDGSTNTQSVSIDSFPESYNAFLSKTVFVGDSICSGLRVYGILPSDNVMAVGNVGARSIFDYKFNAYGTEYALPDALALLKPEYVICSMGMNDVNMTSEEKFCENYDNVLSTIHATLPNAKIYVVSITPISAESTFCSNEKLDRYNQALKSHLSGTSYGYLDVASIMKNAAGALADENNGGDGIHLSPAAYKAYLKRICELTVK